MKKFVSFVRPALGRLLMLVAVLFAFAIASVTAMADTTDITGTVSTLNGYWTSISALAIAIVLFVLGRRLLRKV